jgi:hypothetical protein
MTLRVCIINENGWFTRHVLLSILLMTSSKRRCFTSATSLERSLACGTVKLYQLSPPLGSTQRRGSFTAVPP